MKFKETVGIDVSKKTIDVHTHVSGFYGQYENREQDIREMIKWIFSVTKLSKEEVLFVFEHTGLYSDLLAAVLSKAEIKFAVVPGLEIKRSMGIVRGKSDHKDAAMIARYAYRVREEIKLTSIPPADIQSLKRLLALRDRLVKQRAGFKASYKEHKRVLKVKENKLFFSVQQRQIKSLTKDIEKIETEIQSIIRDNEEVNEIFNLLTTIKGVGKVTAWFMITTTAGFTKFNTWRQYASYSGVAPFPNKSGTSIRGKTQVSNLANKRMKSLLDQCAKIAIQHNKELKDYYDKRIENGKNKMSTLNIIRNKLLARMFAVVKRRSPYVDLKKYAA